MMYRSGIGIRPDPRAARLGLASPDYPPTISLLYCVKLVRTGNLPLFKCLVSVGMSGEGDTVHF